jgi:phage shock protein PspC (stress-responsive transcriptional regulator)
MTEADAVTSEMSATSEATGTSGSRPQWRRSSADRYLAGVAAGIARYLDVDPLLIRIALVIGAVFWPVVLVAYAVVWLVVPVDGASRSLLRSIRKPAAFREALGAVGLIIGAGIILPEVGPGGSPGLRFGVILIACGVLLLVRPQFRYPQTDVFGDGATGADVPTISPETRRPCAPRAARPRSSLGLLAVSLLVLAVGVAAAVDQSDRDVSLGVVSSVALIVVGAALTLSAWRGRARGLILLAPVLVAAWIAFAPANVMLYPESGTRVHTITSAAAVADDYRLGFGSLTVDAGAARLAPGDALELDARVTAGQLRVDVPAGARLRIVGRVGLGVADVHDDRWGSSRLTLGAPAVNRRIDRRWPALAPICERIVPPPWQPEAAPAFVDGLGQPCTPVPLPDNPPEVTVRITLGAGYLEVHRVPPSR